MLLVDIDGVLIPYRHPTVVPAEDEFVHQVAIPPREHQGVAIRPAVIEAVNRWAASGADVQWLTSWGWRTKWLDQVGLPRIPVFYDPDPGEVYFWGHSQRSWKKPTVEDFLRAQKEPLRLAWIDDDAFHYRADRVQGELTEAHSFLSELLLVEPDSVIRLTDAEILRVDEFLGIPSR
ncbi:HAD domain-containing protein [Arthrobacter sp. CAN_A1]|uniref:HAD domain-containing protein n=1 Tax=Arthrobacter sp. CAN_A1 TaxID=2787717 RepID=UPI0018CBA54B